MANTKMTYKIFYQNVINANISEEMTAFAENAIAILDAKNAARKEKGTKTQQDNVVHKQNIVNTMEVGTTYTAASVVEMKIDGVVTTQKASALLRQLVADGVLSESEVKVKGKGKVKGYTLVSENINDNAE